MSFTFSTAVPDANNNPSVDQPFMKQNNIATNGILAVDHITFNAANGGNHLQVHLPGFTAPAVVNGTATEGSVVYSKAGVADSAYAQLSYKNARNVDFPISLIKAYGVFDANGNILSSQSINLTSSGFVVNQGYTLTITTNAVNSGDYAVQATGYADLLNPAFAPVIKRTNATTFIVGFRSVTNSITGTIVQPAQGFSVVVYQL